MSGQRFFQKHEGATAYSALSDEEIESRLAQGYTEVQVVPLDAVVIEGPLPEVTRGNGDRYVVQGMSLRDFHPDDDAVRLAAAYAAIARYEREHPPEDEEQVVALARILHEPYPDSGTWAQAEATARRLVERGVRVGGDSDV